MTKKEIYEALARGEWRRIERVAFDEWLLFHTEAHVLHDMAVDMDFGDFNPDNWRLRKEDDEQD